VPPVGHMQGQVAGGGEGRALGRTPRHFARRGPSRSLSRYSFRQALHFTYAQVARGFLNVMGAPLCRSVAGFGAAFVGSGPAGCLYFTTYELAKGSLLSTGPIGQSPFIAHFTAGLLAEFVSCVLWVPIGISLSLLAYYYLLPAPRVRYSVLLCQGV
jgi:hypothetical protein